METNSLPLFFDAAVRLTPYQIMELHAFRVAYRMYRSGYTQGAKGEVNSIQSHEQPAAPDVALSPELMPAPFLNELNTTEVRFRWPWGEAAVSVLARGGE